MSVSAFRERVSINADYYNTLDIEGFSQMLKDPSFCYKFYWLEAIVHLISENITETTFDEVIDEMIASAWYSVREFHIHLSGLKNDGSVQDGLERAILLLTELSSLPANASKIEIKNAIKTHNRKLKPYKDQLTNMVPYRSLAGFFTKCPERVNWDSIRRLVFYIDKVNREVTRLPYTLGESSRLNKEIYFDPLWIEMIQDNTVSILGWIQYEKVKWLQNNNPEVPGLVYKLAPMDDKMRKLNKVRKLWDTIMTEVSVKDIFSGEELNNNSYDVDHFVPWSFVMNDELWNLMPMQSGLNSVKSNKLPEWEPFFYKFADNQFIMYEQINEKEGLRKLFEGCYRDNLHSIWAGQELYIPGNSKDVFCNILSKNMRPVYDSAKRQGYEIWDYK